MSAARPTRIAQIAVTIRDLDRAKAFYRDTLGLRHVFDAPPGLSFFRCGETRLMLSQPEGPETAGNSILYYAVDDIHASHRDMAAKSVTFEEEPRRIATVGDNDVWLAVCRDSEGNLLGLMSEGPAGRP